jgi:hypothetical protein
MTKLLQTIPSVHLDTTSRSWPFARVGTFLCLPTLRTESVGFAACLPACLSLELSLDSYLARSQLNQSFNHHDPKQSHKEGM